MDGQNNNLDNNTSLQEETNSNKSFVKKVKSHVSELLSTSFGKWFSGDNSLQTNIRHRVYDEDDDNYNIQPPSKRVKMPTPESKRYTNSLSSDFNNFSPISSHSETKTLGNIFDGVAGPSGLQHNDRSPAIRLFNGDKESESGESDASSVSRLRNRTDSRINFHTPPSTHNRSLFNDRPYNSQLNTSLSSKRPSFNASTFGSPNFVDRTLSTKQILSSPFYSGRTVYGGASAYSARQKSAPERSKRQIQVKPVNNSVGNDVSLSKTARRILNALEEFNPVTDAKKIPYPKQRVRSEGILSKYAGANPYVSRERKIPFALNKELHVPTVPDLLKMKLKERLQDSTVAVRQIATTSKSVLNRDDYKIRSKEDDVRKHSNKMKNKLTATRQKNDNQQIEEVKLPAVTLPITTLPKFDFSLPPPPSSAKQPLVTVACNDPPKSVSTTPTSLSVIKKKADIGDVKDQVAQFEFSNPLILADNLKSIIAINDFKFSDPVFKQRDKSTQDVGVNFKVSTENFTLKRKSQGIPPVSAKLSKGSVEEVFNTSVAESLDKFKPAAALWECNVCLIRNAADKLKCAACEAAKPGVETVKNDGAAKTAPSFGDQFKPPSSTWECPTCLIRNKDDVEKCVACETVKPGLKSAAPSGFGFGDAFKKKGNEWECSVCMIRNNEDKTVCQACETPKPGAKVDEKPAKTVDVATFNFGIFPTTASPTKTTGTETIQTPSFSLRSTSVVTSTSTIPTFSFGIPATPVIPPTSVTETKKAIKPVLPIAKVSEPSTVTPKPVQEPTKAPVSSPMFAFSVPPKVSTPVSDPIQSEPTKPTVLSTSPSAFTFGKSSTAITPSLKRSAADSDSLTIENKKPSSAITFQPPAINSLSTPSPITPKPALSQPTTTSSSFMFTPTPTPAHPTTTASTNLFAFAATKTTASSLFGNTVTTTQSPVFNFSQSEKPASTQPTFGATTEKQSTLPMFGSPSSNSLFGSPKSAFDVPPTAQPFGSVAPTVFGSEPKPLMTSFADSPKSQTLFGMEPKPALFGTTEPKAATTFGSEQSAPLFGADPKSTPFGSGTEQKAPIFGSDQKSQSIFGTEQKPPAFGAADNKPFTFGAPAPSNDTAAQSPFSFGAKPAESSKSFFGTAAPAPTPVAGGFNFNSTVTPTAFNFSAPKVENTLPFQSTPSAGNIFNAPPVQPQQQTQPLQNGGFNFGTSANASTSNKTGFNFGAANQFTPAAAPAPTATPSATTGFWGMTNNSNANPVAPTASSFNFGQTAPAQAPPSFNANIKPNFNFTAGNMVTGFSATPENSPVTQRRRLKAVRRNPR